MRAGASPGERVAVVEATGNVGVFAVQLAKLMGAYVVAITRRADEFATELKRLDADEVLTPQEASRASGFDVVVDPVGAGTWGLSSSVLDKGGRYVTAGALTGSEVGLDLRRLYGAQLSVLGEHRGRRADLAFSWSSPRGAVSRRPYRRGISWSEPARPSRRSTAPRGSRIV